MLDHNNTGASAPVTYHVELNWLDEPGVWKRVASDLPLYQAKIEKDRSEAENYIDVHRHPRNPRAQFRIVPANAR